MYKDIFCLIKTCAFKQKISNSALKFDLLAGSQHSMLVKHGFNQRIIALISVQKYFMFLLKWIFYMSKNIFYSIKTCALISNQGRTQGGEGLGLNPSLSLIFHKNFVTRAKGIKYFRIPFAC